MPPSLPGGSIARGSRFSILGLRLGKTTKEVSVSLAQGSSSVAVPVLSVEPTRIEALLPEDAPLGSGRLIVIRTGESSRPFDVKVVPSSFGIFTVNQSGWGPGLIDVAVAGKPVRVSSANPARPGDTVTLTGTGLGNERRPEVYVGGHKAVVTRTMRRKDGFDEVRFGLPAGVPSGCYVPVLVRVEGRLVSNAASMAISHSGSCPQPAYWPLAPFAPGRTTGLTIFSHESLMNQGATVVVEHGTVIFTQAKAQEQSITPVHVVPPVGSCTTSTGTFHPDALYAESLPGIVMANLGGQGRDAGPGIRVSGTAGQRSLQLIPGEAGMYAGELGSSDRFLRGRAPLFFTGAPFTLSAEGGNEVGPFKLALKPPASFAWTNRDLLEIVHRSNGFALEWKDVEPDRLILILIFNVDNLTSALASSLCLASAQTGRFFVPPLILANLPVSGDGGGPPLSGVALASVPLRAVKIMPTRGLDSGFAIVTSLQAKTIAFQ